jgi:hypothetical protein
VRSIDLALYADELAARAATLAAQLERARSRLRQEAIEREARRALDEGSVARLEALGLLSKMSPERGVSAYRGAPSFVRVVATASVTSITIAQPGPAARAWP